MNGWGTINELNNGIMLDNITGLNERCNKLKRTCLIRTVLISHVNNSSYQHIHRHFNIHQETFIYRLGYLHLTIHK